MPYHYAEIHNVNCHIVFTDLLSVNMLNVVVPFVLLSNQQKITAIKSKYETDALKLLLQEIILWHNEMIHLPLKILFIFNDRFFAISAKKYFQLEMRMIKVVS